MRKFAALARALDSSDKSVCFVTPDPLLLERQECENRFEESSRHDSFVRGAHNDLRKNLRNERAPMSEHSDSIDVSGSHESRDHPDPLVHSMKDVRAVDP